VIPALEPRGFGHGSGIWNPDSTKFFVNIPKNASSFVLFWGNSHGWIAGNCWEFKTLNEMLVILRDPMDRWISGIAQYINGFILSVHGPNGPIFPDDPITGLDYVMNAEQFIAQYTDVTERVIFDVISRFDDHVWPQWEILDGLPDCKKKWFLMDDHLESNLSSYLGWSIRDGLDRNQGSANNNCRILQDFFRQRLKKRPELAERIIKHYRKDYELVAKVIDV